MPLKCGIAEQMNQDKGGTRIGASTILLSTLNQSNFLINDLGVVEEMENMQTDKTFVRTCEHH